MTVAELIVELQKCDPMLEVWLKGMQEVEDVIEDEDANGKYVDLWPKAIID